MNNRKLNLNLISWLVIYFPLINLFIGFFVGSSETESAYLSYLRAIVYALIIIFVLTRFGIEKVTRYLLFFFIYLLVLIPFSSNFPYSLSVFLKIVITMGMFPVGYHVLNSFEKLFLFLKYLLFSALILCVNYILAQYFKIGRSAYLEDSFYYGFAGIGSTVSLTYFLLVVPFLTKAIDSLRGKWLLRVTVFLSLLFTIIALKRIAIIALITGYFIYLFKTRYFVKVSRAFISVAFFLILFSPIYLDLFLERLSVRPTEMSDLKYEQRYNDVIVAINDFRTKGIKHALVGTEPFNTPGYFGKKRQVHVDYANLLIGTGIIGLFIYLFIYFTIGRKFHLIYKQTLKRNIHYRLFPGSLLKDLSGIFWAILMSSLVISFSGGLHVVGTRVLLFTLLGGLTGVLNSMNNTFKSYDSIGN